MLKKKNRCVETMLQRCTSHLQYVVIPVLLFGQRNSKKRGKTRILTVCCIGRRSTRVTYSFSASVVIFSDCSRPFEIRNAYMDLWVSIGCWLSVRL